MTGKPELARRLLGGEDARRRPVVETRRVARGHPAVRPERRLERGQVLDGGARSRRLVPGGQAVAVLGAAGGDRHEVGLDLAVRVGLGELVLAAHRERVGPLLGDGGEPVVQVLGGGAHDQRGGVDELLGDDPRVGVDTFAHRVVPHVLDAAGDDHVVGPEGDAPRHRGDRRHRAAAHPVDGEAGDRLRQAGQQGSRAADRQALVTDLRRRRDRDVVDAFRRQLGVAADQLPDAADDQVVGPGLGVHALGSGLAEGRAHSVDEHDVAQRSGLARLGGHGASSR